MRTLDSPHFYCGCRRLSYYCHVTLIGFRFRQVHSSFATFVVAPTQRGHTIAQMIYWLAQIVYWLAQIIYWLAQIVYWLAQIIYWLAQIIYWLAQIIYWLAQLW